MKPSPHFTRQIPIERLEALAEILKDCQPEDPRCRVVWSNIVTGVAEWLYTGRHHYAMNHAWFRDRCGAHDAAL